MTNYFFLDIPPYMKIYFMVNVEKLKFYEHPMIIDRNESIQVPTIVDFSPEFMNGLQEDVLPYRKKNTSCEGDVEYL